MTTDLQLAALRARAFADAVLKPAVHPLAAPLRVGVFQCLDPVPHDQARAASYQPVDVGWRWGPPWSTAWFRLEGEIPAVMAGRPVGLQFDAGTEALLWLDGAPGHGLDRNHHVALLHDAAPEGAPVSLLVEAACHDALGTTSFWWDDEDLRQRWQEPKPGRLRVARLVVLDLPVWRLARSVEFACQLLEAVPADTPRGLVLADALETMSTNLDAASVAAHAGEAGARLEAVLRGQGPLPTTCVAVGHTHIDTAWLWTIGDTRRKCLRSFATALRLMERFPRMTFLASQPQQYAWVEEDAPGLFARIADRVREGRWEIGGPMWVEPDCNVPSGESLVRQLLHGIGYWHRRFGAEGGPRVLFLPDTFGFNAALPQIMALAGLDTFVTSKLAWSQTNEFPQTTFRWRGLDGTEVLAHCLPAEEYNATNTPAELRRGHENCVRKQPEGPPLWLQPFGYGDGGGGPTDWSILHAELAGDCDLLPRVRLDTLRAFAAELHDSWQMLRRGGRDLPVWDGELYLELHRGTFTTQAWIKQANHDAERGLRWAEWLLAAGPTRAPEAQLVEEREALLDAWSTVLLNQFHAILPGTSIGPVYAEARTQHDGVRAVTTRLIGDAMTRWADGADTAGLAQPVLVFNPGSAARSGLVETEAGLAYAADVPAVGVRVIDAAAPHDVDAARVEQDELVNGHLRVAIDRAGRVAKLVHEASGRDACSTRDGATRPLNQLVLHDDRPRRWEAWDIDVEDLQHPRPVDTPVEMWSVVESGPLRAAIEVGRPLGRTSQLKQRFVLEAGSPRLLVHTRVEWAERRTLLRALFPVDVRARH
ncbi:MAG: alpha-mannosidase, partial [Planctomycetota bacterium]